MAQTYLLEKNQKEVIVYHIGLIPRNNMGNFQTRGNFNSDQERDAAMTLNSDQDILWFRSKEEQKNYMVISTNIE